MNDNTVADSDAWSEFTKVYEGDIETFVEGGESKSIFDVDRTAPSRDGLKTAEQWLNAIKPIVAGSLRRHLLGYVSTASAVSVGSSKSLNSAEDVAAASTALATATAHLDQILKYGTVDDESTVQGYLAKVQARPESRLFRLGLDSLRVNRYEEALIRAAFTSSSRVYDMDHSSPQLVCRPGGDFKPCSVAIETVQGRSIAIVAIRGTADVADWILDSNGDPTPHPKLLQGASNWHKGILRAANHMEKSVAERIIHDIRQSRQIDAIVFAGHSLGGAVAQIFYAACSTPDMAMSKAVQGIPAVHCVSFGAPPVSTKPFKELTHAGMFLAIINEGDPVALAQEAYIRALLSVYTLSDAKLKDLLGAYVVPKPALRVCGNAVVLVDQNPDKVDVEEQTVLALEVDAGEVETRLFGDPWMHSRVVYAAMLDAWHGSAGEEKDMERL